MLIRLTLQWWSLSPNLIWKERLEAKFLPPLTRYITYLYYLVKPQKLELLHVEQRESLDFMWWNVTLFSFFSFWNLYYSEAFPRMGKINLSTFLLIFYVSFLMFISLIFSCSLFWCRAWCKFLTFYKLFFLVFYLFFLILFYF